MTNDQETTERIIVRDRGLVGFSREETSQSSKASEVNIRKSVRKQALYESNDNRASGAVYIPGGAGGSSCPDEWVWL